MMHPKLAPWQARLVPCAAESGRMVPASGLPVDALLDPCAWSGPHFEEPVTDQYRESQARDDAEPPDGIAERLGNHEAERDGHDRKRHHEALWSGVQFGTALPAHHTMRGEPKKSTQRDAVTAAGTALSGHQKHLGDRRTCHTHFDRRPDVDVFRCEARWTAPRCSKPPCSCPQECTRSR